MNRFTNLKSMVNYARKSNNQQLCNPKNLTIYGHSNLLLRNEFLISSFFKLEKKSNKDYDQKQQAQGNYIKMNLKQKGQNLNIYSEELKQLAKQILQQTAYFAAPLQHSKTYHYGSYFLPTVRMLHSKKLIENEKYLKNTFRQLKTTITPTTNKFFSPQSVTRIMEQFSKIDFDGDESISLDTMVNYVKENLLDFTQSELERFQAAYKQIMVSKALGPVRFKAMVIEKTYKSQTERKALLIKQSLKKIFHFQDQNSDREITLDEKLDKKWIIIKVPSKKLTIFTYPKSLSFQQEEAYSYIYDLKTTINSIVSKTLREKNKLLLKKFQINVYLRQYLPQHVDSKVEHIQSNGLVYKQKKLIVDEFEKYEEMKRMSLKEQILKMKEKKKELKLKEKLKQKQRNVENPIKLQNPNKKLDFFETIKFSIDQIHKQTLEKLNKTKTRDQIPKRHKKKAAKLEQENQQDEEMENVDEQIEQEDKDEEKISNEGKLEMNPEMIEKMRTDLQIFNKKVAQKQERANQAKKQKPQLLKIQSFMQLKEEQITIKNILTKTLANSSIDQIREFSAYIELISALKKALQEMDKAQRIKDYMKKAVEQDKRNQSEKDEVNEKKFRIIKDEMNEPLDTQIQLDTSLEKIFADWLKCKSKGVEARKSQNMSTLQHDIVIMSQEELLNSIKAAKRREVQNHQNPKPVVKEQDPTTIDFKEKIFKKTFLSTQNAR